MIILEVVRNKISRKFVYVHKSYIMDCIIRVKNLVMVSTYKFLCVFALWAQYVRGVVKLQ
jgi:hypothetical protein